jgi:hypothetical protein
MVVAVVALAKYVAVVTRVEVVELVVHVTLPKLEIIDVQEIHLNVALEVAQPLTGQQLRVVDLLSGVTQVMGDVIPVLAVVVELVAQPVINLNWETTAVQVVTLSDVS